MKRYELEKVGSHVVESREGGKVKTYTATDWWLVDSFTGEVLDRGESGGHYKKVDGRPGYLVPPERDEHGEPESDVFRVYFLDDLSPRVKVVRVSFVRDGGVLRPAWITERATRFLDQLHIRDSSRFAEKLPVRVAPAGGREDRFSRDPEWRQCAICGADFRDVGNGLREVYCYYCEPRAPIRQGVGHLTPADLQMLQDARDEAHRPVVTSHLITEAGPARRT